MRGNDPERDGDGLKLKACPRDTERSAGPGTESGDQKVKAESC